MFIVPALKEEPTRSEEGLGRYMSSRHLVDPDILPALNILPIFDCKPENLPAFRAMTEEFIRAKSIPQGLGVTVEEREIVGGDGQPMNILIYRPDSAASPAPAICHIHGGGYIMCSAYVSDIANRKLAAATGALIMSVDYRLAPETPHPGPVEDCFAGLTWLHAHAEELDIDQKRVAVKGESAGGGLAAAVALLARDRGGPAICHQHLRYPMLDDRTGTTQLNPYVGEFVWTAELNRFGWQALLGRAPGGANVSPYAAPARAGDVAALPPTYIATAALDLFVEENLEYARRLIHAGVPTELHVYPGAYHGFDMNELAPVAQAAERDSIVALNRALNPRNS